MPYIPAQGLAATRRPLEPARQPANVTEPTAPAALSSNDADLALVARAVAGESRAFDLLVIKYQRRIERLIARFVRGDEGLAQDLAQETFIRAYRALANFRGEAQFYTWLYRIAVNTAKRELMDAKRDPVVTESSLRKTGDDDDETSVRLTDLSTDETPETALAAKQIGDQVQAALAELSEDLRQAVTLREIEGLSYEEISEVMQCPIGTVRSRIFRAREAISLRIKPMLEKQTGKRW